MKKLTLALITLTILTFCAKADKLDLKDGRSFEGKIVRTDKKVTVVTDKGKLYQFDSKMEKKTETAKKPVTPEKTEIKTIIVNDKNPVVRITTDLGDMDIELFEDKVPNTVANIIELAESGFYKGMKFHRVINGFMAQGGCPNSKAGASGMPGTGGPGYRFDDEIDKTLKHTKPGILSMANSGPKTNGSQFFICFKATPWLDGRHAVFGQVVKGLDVLTKLEAIGTRRGTPTKQVGFDIKVISKQAHPYKVKKI